MTKTKQAKKHRIFAYPRVMETVLQNAGIPKRLQQTSSTLSSMEEIDQTKRWLRFFGHSQGV